MNVNSTMYAIKLAERLFAEFNNESNERLSRELLERDKLPKDGSDAGKAFERGFEAGLKLALKACKFDMGEMSVSTIVDAVNGPLNSAG